MRKILGKFPKLRKILLDIRDGKIRSSADYWEDRYKQGGSSGCGSVGHLAHFKADFINRFTQLHKIKTVTEFGCGDGSQLQLASYKSYTGIDVSQTIIEQCRFKFKNDNTKVFIELKDFFKSNQINKAELVLSLDVIYHLVEDNVFEQHIKHLFEASERFVIIYSSNFDGPDERHVKHRRFTDFIEKNISEVRLIELRKNDFPFSGDNSEGSLADFYIYEKTN